MALAKDETTSSSLYGKILDYGSSIQFPYMEPYGPDEYIQKQDHQVIMNYSSSVSNSSGGNFVHSNGTSLLSFHQGDNHHYQLWQGCCSNIISNNSINLQIASKTYQDEANEWLFDDTTLADLPLDSVTQPISSFNKRPQMEEENMQGLKKQRIMNPSKKAKSSTAKDPQSIAAKNRRERISERLKILQDLVPNGSKVDLVTMLEKAISYVKFLQLQVKVLATDEFWPEAGGKAPDISQVREAIDAILSSQRTER